VVFPLNDCSSDITDGSSGLLLPFYCDLPGEREKSEKDQLKLNELVIEMTRELRFHAEFES